MHRKSKPHTEQKKVQHIVKVFTALFLVVSINANAQVLEKRFQEVLDSVYKANPESLGILVHVESPARKISWTAAVGYSSKETKQPVNKDQPALIASNTKTYVSAAILKLVEEGKIQLDQPIKGLLNSATEKLLRTDGYDPDKISIKHLLSHTSGIADYVNNDYFEFVDANPQHKWSRDEQIQLSVKTGGPLAEPGKVFSYGDINYLLLTEILENETGKPFYVGIRDLLSFKKHKLKNTWFVDLEKHPKQSRPLVHHYYDKYDWDSYNLDPSWDLYGGGGLASTVEDLAMFFQLLFEGKIIRDPELLSQMYAYVLPEKDSAYCLGLRNISFHGFTAYYHGGFWGTDVMYVPELNTSISVFTLQKDKRGLNADISKVILQALKK